MCSKGSHRWCVLLSLLFLLYTNDCQSMVESRYIIKFADDSVIVSLQQDPGWAMVQSWTNQCVSKIEEMPIDFHRNPPVTTPTFINDIAITQLANISIWSLSWMAKPPVRKPKAPRWIPSAKSPFKYSFFFTQVRIFNVDGLLLKMLCSSFIESVLTFVMICWFGNFSIFKKTWLRKIVKLCQKTIGTNLNNRGHVYQVSAMKRAWAILADSQQPLHAEIGICNRQEVHFFWEGQIK